MQVTARTDEMQKVHTAIEKLCSVASIKNRLSWWAKRRIEPRF